MTEGLKIQKLEKVGYVGGCQSSASGYASVRSDSAEPHGPCKAMRTLRRCGSLAEAIADLEKQLEEA